MSKIAILFPGQGSQFVGMGKEFLESDSDAQALMATAEEISGFPLGKLCLEGPMEDLTRTLHLQPAITVLNLICWQAMAKAGVKGDFLPAIPWASIRRCMPRACCLSKIP